jgi:hypothetical protein
MKYKTIPLEDIKKYIYMKLNNPKCDPVSICRAYEYLSGNTVSSKNESERSGEDDLLNVIIHNPKEV